MAKKPAAKETYTYQLGDQINGFVVTKAGLPNTCSITGQEITEGYWLAVNDDEARAGKGISVAAFEDPTAA